MKSVRWICLCLLIGAVACDDDVDEEEEDAAADAARDPSPDSPLDLAADVLTDLAFDVALDSAQDTVADSAEDAPTDGAEDTLEDADEGDEGEGDAEVGEDVVSDESDAGDAGSSDLGDDTESEDLGVTDQSWDDLEVPSDLDLGAGETPCGGPRSLRCGRDEYCDYGDDKCGTGAAWGVCRPSPDFCTLDYDPVCGCDGTVHSNDCDAASDGTDVSGIGGCEAPEGTFACGSGFCVTDTQYCSIGYPGVCCPPPSYHCAPLPSECGATPSCDCLSTEDAGACDCAGSAASGLSVSCYYP